jgi:hypothetical protein
MQSRKSGFLSIKSLLENNSEILCALYTRASDISRLQDKLRKHFGDPLAPHFRVADFNKETLILHTDSPAWASRLRFRIPDILDFVQTHGMKNLHSIRIKVIQNANAPPEITKKPAISDDTARLIHDTAESINDENLRRSLLRLGSRKS